MAATSSTVVVETAKATKLTAEEKKALKRCESAIEKGQRAFLAIAPAVREIAEDRLWRGYRMTNGEVCQSMKDYAEDKWDMNSSDVSRMKKAAVLLENLQAAGAEVLPRNLGQCNQLSDLSKEKQVEAWETVLAKGQKVTAALIKSVVEEMFPTEAAEAAEAEAAETTVERKAPQDIDAILTSLQSFEDGLAEIRLEEDERAKLLQQLDAAERLIAEIRAKLAN